MLTGLISCDLPTEPIPLTPDNLFFVEQSDTNVDMQFTSPQEFGATSYTLQYSEDDGVTWENYQYNGSDLVAAPTYDNFSLKLAGDYRLRLLITGGTYDGETSNEMDVVISTQATYFSDWSLGEKIDNTGIIAPRVGYGLLADFTVKEVGTDAVVDTSSSALRYQWYRINPVDYEDITLIAGATTLSYTTTTADIGYSLLIRATGDEITIGGYIQLMSALVVK